LREYDPFDGRGNRSAQRKAPVSDPRRKSLLYGATYLMPQAGIEPTPSTDIGYKPVSQTGQTLLQETITMIIEHDYVVMFIVLPLWEQNNVS
jgi:hypothetical protein